MRVTKLQGKKVPRYTCSDKSFAFPAIGITRLYRMIHDWLFAMWQGRVFALQYEAAWDDLRSFGSRATSDDTIANILGRSLSKKITYGQCSGRTNDVKGTHWYETRQRRLYQQKWTHVMAWICNYNFGFLWDVTMHAIQNRRES